MVIYSVQPTDKNMGICAIRYLDVALILNLKS